ncbi:hypothetical protein [Nonomuraea jabiensis]|uniref:DUF4240 domain-containing protein n=1 Tax=Nonomuraea jabiensis TaxID=882448 RepID=A0A7W9G3V0_9ACTN|nr:hypothetical protein [Nonomuraea jabiensis]MBB5776628.1 hypothetical protein [Nonomuraea jabiensis]
MTRDDFWAILAQCPPPAGPDDDCDELVSRLGRLSPPEIVEEMRRRYPRLPALLDEADALA